MTVVFVNRTNHIDTNHPFAVKHLTS